MKKFLTVIFASFLAGCTSNIAMLQADNLESDEYRFIFGKMLLNYDKAKKLSLESRMLNYETQLNFVLQQDVNTVGCSIVPGTISFGEPGSQGEARIRCIHAIKLRIQEGIHNRDGSPVYFYVISHHESKLQ